MHTVENVLPVKHVQNCDRFKGEGETVVSSHMYKHTLVSNADGSLGGSQHGANELCIGQQKEKQPETHGRFHTTDRVSFTHSKSEVINSS